MRKEGVWPAEKGHIFQSSGSCLAPRHEAQPSGPHVGKDRDAGGEVMGLLVPWDTREVPRGSLPHDV